MGGAMVAEGDGPSLADTGRGSLCHTVGDENVMAFDYPDDHGDEGDSTGHERFLPWTVPLIWQSARGGFRSNERTVIG